MRESRRPSSRGGSFSGFSAPLSAPRSRALNYRPRLSSAREEEEGIYTPAGEAKNTPRDCEGYFRREERECSARSPSGSGRVLFENNDRVDKGEERERERCKKMKMMMGIRDE